MKSHTRTSSARPNTSSPGISLSNSPSRLSTWRFSRASPSCPARDVALSRLDPYISRQPPNHRLKRQRERAIKKHFIILLYYLMYLREERHITFIELTPVSSLIFSNASSYELIFSRSASVISLLVSSGGVDGRCVYHKYMKKSQ